jgi:hypothetical protein
MKIALLYYDGFSEFEVVLTGLLFKEYNLVSIALEIGNISAKSIKDSASIRSLKRLMSIQSIC